MLFFLWANGGLVERIKLLYGCGNRTFKVANVKLGHLHCRTLTCVAHHETYLHGIGFYGRATGKLQRAIGESGVTKPMTEGVGGVRVGKNVVAPWLFGRAFLVVIALIGGQRVVIYGQLTHAFGERHGQTTRWRELAEEHSGQRKACLFAAIPLHHQCANVMSETLHYQRPTRYQHNHQRFAQGHEAIHKLLLRAREGKFG